MTNDTGVEDVVLLCSLFARKKIFKKKILKKKIKNYLQIILQHRLV